MSQENMNSPADSRRDFVKKMALGAGVLVSPPWKPFAGPFNLNKDSHLIPADKKLSKEWIQALYERGTPEQYTFLANELKYIGMPVGGVGCGQLYLGGDGRLWLWHIFKTVYTREKNHGQRFKAMTLGGHYANPDQVFERETHPVSQGTAIRISSDGKTITKQLSSRDFKNISFRGEYPIGKIKYHDNDLPVEINLEAFSPFIPTDLDRSALPVTIMCYKVKNTSSKVIQVELAGWLENAVLPYLESGKEGIRRNTLVAGKNRLTVYSTAEAISSDFKEVKQDVVFEDFEKGNYHQWEAQGEAFGSMPIKKGTEGVPVQGELGDYFVSSFNVPALKGKPNTNTYHHGRITLADKYTGSLTSKPFTISHRFITFRISGGYHPGKTALNLLIDGKIVRSQTGDHHGKMAMRNFDVRDFIGENAVLQVIDNHQGIWGSIAVDHIVFTDKKPTNLKIEDMEGYGSMSWTLFQPSEHAKSALNLEVDMTPDEIFDSLQHQKELSTESKPMNSKQLGALSEQLTLQPGEAKEVTYILSWFFPYLNEQETQTGQLLALKDIQFLNRHYHNWFNSANQVAEFVASEFKQLAGITRLWNHTWYDSSLPYWLLDRSFIPIDCMASNTFLWFDNGRIWGWEGVECCPGTCQHVWQYAQGMARIFPKAERILRESTDLGYSFRDDGGLGHRDETAGQYGKSVAHDGHCGTIMRIYREHKLSSDNTFLKHNYQKIKKAVQYIIHEDKDQDGLLEGAQANTLDARWYGPMGWVSSLYLGALAAGKEMALEIGDQPFADICTDLIEKGQKNMVEKLFNGEYFIHIPDRINHPNAISSNDGCHIDQVLGQSFAKQIGIPGRIIPVKETVLALESIWKYNFAPDAFAYQEKHKPIKGARIYATQGEAGTIMTTWPKSDNDEWAVPGMANREEGSDRWQGPGGYFDETMNGFEYQVASHMIWEGMIEKGLATAKAVHDRYHALKRNPFNEIECSDHYSRSMASYGVFLAVCGFDFHGPKGHISFDPKLSPENFKAPFTTASGWGSFTQKRDANKQTCRIQMAYGQVRLQQITINTGPDRTTVKLLINGNLVTSQAEVKGNRCVIKWDGTLLRAGDWIEIEVNP